MKVITKNEMVSYTERKTTPGTPGIYVLVDPRCSTPMYVGSTIHAEHRLYSHIHQAGGNRHGTPKERWISELRANGLMPEMWVLEEGEFGPPQSAARHEAEARWIVICQELFGGGEMNSRLVPEGHVNLKNKRPSQSAEIRTLRAKVKELQREVAFLRGNQGATLQHDVQRCTVLHVAQLQKVQRNATSPYGDVAVLH